MFGLGVTEVLVILIVAFLLFGPQQLPEVGRQVGKAVKGFKDATDDIRKSVEPELNLMQAEMKSVEQEVRRKRGRGSQESLEGTGKRHSSIGHNASTGGLLCKGIVVTSR